MSVLRLAFRAAVRRNEMYHHRLDMEELTALAFFCAWELVHTWRPRKQTFGGFVALKIRNAMWSYSTGWEHNRKRNRPLLSGDDFAENRRVVSLASGCFREVEDVLFEILDYEDAMLFARRYGLHGERQHQNKELMTIYGLTEDQVIYRVRRCVQQLHNQLCSDDTVTHREICERLAGKFPRAPSQEHKISGG